MMTKSSALPKTKLPPALPGLREFMLLPHLAVAAGAAAVEPPETPDLSRQALLCRLHLPPPQPPQTPPPPPGRPEPPPPLLQAAALQEALRQAETLLARHSQQALRYYRGVTLEYLGSSDTPSDERLLPLRHYPEFQGRIARILDPIRQETRQLLQALLELNELEPTTTPAAIQSLVQEKYPCHFEIKKAPTRAEFLAAPFRRRHAQIADIAYRHAWEMCRQINEDQARGQGLPPYPLPPDPIPAAARYPRRKEPAQQIQSPGPSARPARIPHTLDRLAGRASRKYASGRKY